MPNEVVDGSLMTPPKAGGFERVHVPQKYAADLGLCVVVCSHGSDLDFDRRADCDVVCAIPAPAEALSFIA